MANSFLGYEYYNITLNKSSKSLKKLLVQRKTTLLALRYEFVQTPNGVIAYSRSPKEMIKELESILVDLHVTARDVLNAIYSGCNYFQNMYLSQKRIGMLCGISRRQATRLINMLWRLGFFIKRRRMQTQGSKWLSCVYKMPNWLFSPEIRSYFRNLIPALGEALRRHGALYSLSVNINPSVDDSHTKETLYVDSIAEINDAKNDNLQHVDPPETSNMLKDTKKLLEPLTLQHQLPLVTQQEKNHQGGNMQLGMSSSLPMYTFVEAEAYRHVKPQRSYLEQIQYDNDQAALEEERILTRAKLNPPVAPPPPVKKKSPELQALQQKYLTILDMLNKIRKGELALDRLEEFEARKITLKAEIEELKLKESYEN